MIEVFTRMRLPIAPVALDEVARLGDITTGGLGIFWFEQDSGDLFWVTDSGATNPFEFDPATGNLYYLIQGP